MSKKPLKDTSKSRRQFTDQFKERCGSDAARRPYREFNRRPARPDRYNLVVPMETRTVATKWPRRFVA